VTGVTDSVHLPQITLSYSIHSNKQILSLSLSKQPFYHVLSIVPDTPCQADREKGSKENE